jgi:hypothetical protein
MVRAHLVFYPLAVVAYGGELDAAVVVFVPNLPASTFEEGVTDEQPVAVFINEMLTTALLSTWRGQVGECRPNAGHRRSFSRDLDHRATFIYHRSIRLPQGKGLSANTYVIFLKAKVVIGSEVWMP